MSKCVRLHWTVETKTQLRCVSSCLVPRPFFACRGKIVWWTDYSVFVPYSCKNCDINMWCESVELLWHMIVCNETFNYQDCLPQRFQMPGKKKLWHFQRDSGVILLAFKLPSLLHTYLDCSVSWLPIFPAMYYITYAMQPDWPAKIPAGGMKMDRSFTN